MNNNIPSDNQQYHEEDSINLRHLFETVIVYWKWILGSLILSLAIGFLFLMTKAPLYESTASILINDPKSQMGEMAILNELKQIGVGSGFSTVVSNEERVLKSTHLMMRVADEMGLHTRYYQKEKFYKKEIYQQTPYKVSLDSAAFNALTNDVKLSINPSKNSYEIDVKINKEKSTYTLDNLPGSIQTSVGRIYIESVRENKIKDKICVEISPLFRMGSKMRAKGVQTKIDKSSDEIWITFRSQNPQLSKDALNTIIRLYNIDAIEQITQSAIFSGVFIDERLTSLEKELKEEEHRIEDYKQRNKLTNIQADAALFLSTNSQYYDQLTEIEIQLQLIDYLQSYIKDQSSQKQMIPDPGLKDMGVAGVINEYNQLIIARDKLGHSGGSENPMSRTINQQIESMYGSVKESMNNLEHALKIRHKELQDQNRLLSNKLQSIPRQERELVEITRQQQVKESLYIFLLQKREENSLSKAVATSKARVLNPPYSVRQVEPRKALIMLVFFFLGLALPIAFILIRRVLNTIIFSREDVEAITDLPILAELAQMKKSDIFFDHSDNEEINSELFRLLRAKLQFTLNAPEEKVVLVTSIQPGEGKSFVSANLATSLSMLDKKVVLLGLDLRKPVLSERLSMTDSTGVSNYLAGLETDIDKIIHTVPSMPNMDFIPAGVIPPNPNELIMKKELEKLIDELKQRYDYIIIDTAPVGAVSDTYLLDRISDVNLFICRSDYSDRRNVEFINRLDKEGSFKRIYLVINDIDFESNRYTYQRKYGYGYGYGYAEGYKK